MSSDSEDEYYTNSVSRLRALKKQEILECEPKNTPNLFSDGEDNSEKPQLDVTISVSEKEEVVSVPDEETSVICELDEETDTSLNIISMVNEVLEKSKRVSRRQPRRAVKNPQDPVAKKIVKGKRKNRRKIYNFNLKRKAILDLSNVSIEQHINLADVDLTEEADQMVVKVCWCFQNTEKFTVRRFEPLEKIFSHFAERHNIPESRLLFTLDNSNQVISPTDTPDSLKLNVGSIIEAGFLNLEQQDCVEIRSKVAEDSIELKVQLKDRKHPLFVSLRTTDTMEVFMHKCAEQLSLPLNNLKFYFDGDVIQFSDTVVSLELSGGECIDCVRI